jgi:hypothetical protein
VATRLRLARSASASVEAPKGSHFQAHNKRKGLNQACRTSHDWREIQALERDPYKTIRPRVTRSCATAGRDPADRVLRERLSASGVPQVP